MNNLVDYDADSEEDSPRRKSFEAYHNVNRETEEILETGKVEEREAERQDSRERKDSEVWDEVIPEDEEVSPSSETTDGFVEPPPPRRRVEEHSPSVTPSGRGIIKVSSTASLVFYEKDAFEREDDRLRAEDSQASTSAHGEAIREEEAEEPPPPGREEKGEESNSERDHAVVDEDEERIDKQLEECRHLMNTEEKNFESPETPFYEDPMEGPDTPAQADETVFDESEVVIPPEPDTPCDPQVVANFEKMFALKERGHNFNEKTTTRKDFLNPSIYELFIESFGLNETGTNWPKSFFDPTGFPADCYYDKIGEQQRLLMEKKQAAPPSTSTASATEQPPAKKPKN